MLTFSPSLFIPASANTMPVYLFSFDLVILVSMLPLSDLMTIDGCRVLI